MKILTNPDQYYDEVLAGCRNANCRIVLASLYLGQGQLERKMVGEVSLLKPVAEDF